METGEILRKFPVKGPNFLKKDDMKEEDTTLSLKIRRQWTYESLDRHGSSARS